MKVIVKVDVRKDIARIKAAAGRQYQKEMDKFMMRQGRTLISSSGRVPGLVQITAPHSQGKKGTAAKKQGESAVSADINKVYGSAGAMYAEIKLKNRFAAAGFWKAVKKDKDWDKANAIAMQITGHQLESFDGGSSHKQRRNNYGRVSGKKPSLFVRESGGSETSASPAIRKYIKLKQKNVGILASLLIASGEREFGHVNGVPKWVRDHVGRFSGGACKLERPGDGKWIIKARVASPRAQKDLQRKFDKVVIYRLDAIQRELPSVARAIEKKLKTALASR